MDLHEKHHDPTIIDSLTKPKYNLTAHAHKALTIMIKSIEINGYRGFSRFEISGLGRVNLLVGKNNSGKTSVLEVLDLLASAGEPSVLWRIVTRRDERRYNEILSEPRRGRAEYEVNHLFYGHEINIGSEFSIKSKNHSSTQHLKCKVAKPTDEMDLLFREESEPSSYLILGFTGKPEPRVPALALTAWGSLRGDVFDAPRIRRGRRYDTTKGGRSYFISPESLSSDSLTLMWNSIALTNAQERVVKALRFIEPKIIDIAPQITSPHHYYDDTRGGFIVKLKGIDRPIPIGSLGDGTWRILALAIAISQAKDGILLVDEIDTGLHHTVMEDMWRLIAETAKELNVQVFATTHSYDCVHSLSAICHADVTNDSQVSLQRIDPSRKSAIPFSEAEIRMAADRHIEVR